MRVSDQDYVRSCVAKERQLAHLLGHPHVEESYESALMFGIVKEVIHLLEHPLKPAHTTPATGAHD